MSWSKHRHLWEAGGVTALALLLLGGCGQVASRVSVSPPATPAPTYTPAPAGPLAWKGHQPATGDAPHGKGSNPAITFSRADGALAYECVAAVDGSTAPAAIWVTHDHAGTWQRGADLPQSDGFRSCAIQPDDLDPAVAIAMVPASIPPMLAATLSSRTYATFDAGAHWTPLTGPYDTVDQVATSHGVTFALFARHTMSAALRAATLARSTDHLHTWTSIDPPGGLVGMFWLNAVTGELLAATRGDFGVNFALAVSNDAGNHWQTLPTPFATANGYVVRQPIASQPWQICAVHYPNSVHPGYGTPTPTPPPHLLSCTVDGGQTWVDRGGSDLNAGVIGIANDGSVLKVGKTGQLLRLTPGGESWESLGPLPGCGELAYVSGTGQGSFWCLPLPYSTPNATPTPPQRLLYTASYA